MRFLVTSNSKFPAPPEIAGGLFDGMTAWVEENKASGKIELAFSFPGRAAGGAILNVESLEELDAILNAAPMTPFAEVEVQPIVDLVDSLARGKAAFQAMAGG